MVARRIVLIVFKVLALRNDLYVEASCKLNPYAVATNSPYLLWQQQPNTVTIRRRGTITEEFLDYL